MKRIFIEISLFTIWCALLIFLLIKLTKQFEAKKDRELQQIEVQFKKFKFGKEKDLFEDKTISQRKLETLDRIYEYKRFD
jgi:hypothetical protein